MWWGKRSQHLRTAQPCWSIRLPSEHGHCWGNRAGQEGWDRELMEMPPNVVAKTGEQEAQDHQELFIGCWGGGSGIRQRWVGDAAHAGTRPTGDTQQRAPQLWRVLCMWTPCWWSLSSQTESLKIGLSEHCAHSIPQSQGLQPVTIAWGHLTNRWHQTGGSIGWSPTQRVRGVEKLRL